MPETTNPLITRAWSVIAEPTDNFLFTAISTIPLEVAVTATEVAPTIEHGHPVSAYERESPSRAALGAGYVWARIAPGHSDPVSTVATLTVWSA